jgi:hypothetical protein
MTLKELRSMEDSMAFCKRYTFKMAVTSGEDQKSFESSRRESHPGTRRLSTGIGGRLNEVNHWKHCRLPTVLTPSSKIRREGLGFQ